ncbi:MAG: hypothetical protein P4L41_18630 [Flavipsychrobacter sp.]|nr:hypothetical protein [Flavipsychrobacter sp.]
MITCFCHANGQVVFGILGGYGLPLFDKGNKAPGDPKNSSADFAVMEGGSIMVHAGKSIGLGLAVYGQTYSFTMHNGTSNATGYNGTDLVHHSDYLFAAPTISFILDHRDHLQFNLSPAIGLNTRGHEYVKGYTFTTLGNTTTTDSINTSENIAQFIFCITAQFQQNLALSRHFRISFIESYSYMATQLSQTNIPNRNINPGYASLQLAFTYRIHKKNVKFFTPSFY